MTTKMLPGTVLTITRVPASFMFDAEREEEPGPVRYRLPTRGSDSFLSLLYSG
jgi:hypothetical protein